MKKLLLTLMLICSFSAFAMAAGTSYYPIETADYKTIDISALFNQPHTNAYPEAPDGYPNWFDTNQQTLSGIPFTLKLSGNDVAAFSRNTVEWKPEPKTGLYSLGGQVVSEIDLLGAGGWTDFGSKVVKVRVYPSSGSYFDKTFTMLEWYNANSQSVFSAASGGTKNLYVNRIVLDSPIAVDYLQIGEHEDGGGAQYLLAALTVKKGVLPTPTPTPSATANPTATVTPTPSPSSSSGSGSYGGYSSAPASWKPLTTLCSEVSNELTGTPNAADKFALSYLLENGYGSSKKDSPYDVNTPGAPSAVYQHDPAGLSAKNAWPYDGNKYCVQKADRGDYNTLYYLGKESFCMVYHNADGSFRGEACCPKSLSAINKLGLSNTPEQLKGAYDALYGSFCCASALGVGSGLDPSKIVPVSTSCQPPTPAPSATPTPTPSATASASGSLVKKNLQVGDAVVFSNGIKAKLTGLNLIATGTGTGYLATFEYSDVNAILETAYAKPGDVLTKRAVTLVIGTSTQSLVEVSYDPSLGNYLQGTGSTAATSATATAVPTVKPPSPTATPKPTATPYKTPAYDPYSDYPSSATPTKRATVTAAPAVSADDEYVVDDSMPTKKPTVTKKPSPSPKKVTKPGAQMEASCEGIFGAIGCFINSVISSLFGG